VEKKMNLKKQVSVLALTVIASLTMTNSIVSAQDKTIIGVWRTVVTQRNCQTGAPIGPGFPGLFTFNEGGTMSEYGINPGSNPALRSPGHGVWQRHGQQDYSFIFTYYRYDANGVFIGSQEITAALKFGLGGDEFTTNSAIEVFDVNHNRIGTGCGIAAGTRF
jgi:hypothetical protein